jgi:2-iminobutanoate/2-iminopropanoate deaminase
MGKRKVINIPGVAHSAPIPMGVKIGQMVFSSAIIGKDPETQTFPEDLKKQAELVFQNLRTFMEIAEGTVDDIAHVNVFIKKNSMIEFVNQEWIVMFPDENDRPARHTVVADLPSGILVQLEIIAVLN